VVNWTGLTRYFVLFVIDLKARKVEIAGIFPGPDGEWMNQVGRNLTDCEEGFLNGSRYLIHDRDPVFTRSFQEILRSSGVDALQLPARSPNLNAYAERFVRPIKSECLAQIIPLGERHQRHAVKAYTAHYHVERNHQGLDNRLIDDRYGVVDMNSTVERRERPGGVLNYYYRRAA
jgi:transposase InsO family protein